MFPHFPPVLFHSSYFKYLLQFNSQCWCGHRQKMDEKMFLKKVKDMWSWSNGAVKKKKKQSGRTANVRQTSPEWLCSRTPEQTLHYMIPVHSIDKLKLFPPCRLWQAQATFSSNSTLSILFFLSCLRGSSAPISLHLLPSSHFLSSVQTLRVISQAFCCLDF